MKEGKDLRRAQSSLLVDPKERSVSRAMLHAVGFTREDFRKSQVGVASTWAEVTPCNIHIDKLAEQCAAGVNAAGGKAVKFNTITISDGISMGSPGMRYSLVSREIIADSIEAVAGCEHFDGLVCIGGCDKNMPGCLIAMARLNRPSVFVYGGSIMPGKLDGKDLDIVSCFEAVGANASGNLSDSELQAIEEKAIPGAGACGGMYTANTMASAIEALGMSLPNSSAQTAIGEDKMRDCFDAGAAVLTLLKKGIKPSDIMTKEAFQNAITVVTALGGSTNAVLHLLAIAHSIGVDLDIEEFNKIGQRTPFLADLKPSGKYVMYDLIKIGGIIPLMNILLSEGLLNGDCLTVSGKTLAENLAKFPKKYPTGQTVVRPFSNPIKSKGHLVILRGNISPRGSVAKITGKEGEFFSGSARVFDSEQEALEAILRDKINKGDVLVLRGLGPKGAPGMPEMLSPTSAIMGKGLGKDVALITDGRFSGGSHGFVVGHIAPEMYDGGLIGIIKDGDKIKIDAKNRLLDLDISQAEIDRRLQDWQKPELRENRGALAKYARQVSCASRGAISDDF